MHALLVEDNDTDAYLLGMQLQHSSIAPVGFDHVQTLEDALDRLDQGSYDVVLLDLTLPDSEGLDTFRTARSQAPDMPFIVLTGVDDQGMARTAVQEGAQDFLIKGEASGPLLARALRYAVERQRLIRGLEEEVRTQTEELRNKAAELARSNASLQREMAERQRAEEALRASEAQLRVAQRLEAVGRLAAGVAHDFNNTLTVVLGSATLLRETLDPDDRRGEEVAAIEDAAQRGASLTRQLMAFGRRQLLTPESLSLNDVVRAMQPLLERVCGDDVELVLELEPELAQTHVDREQLERAILNLCMNAREAMPEGGRVTLSTANVALGDDQARVVPRGLKGSHVRLTVQDTGVGMDEGTRERVFEPFFTTKGRSDHNTGLGLATVYGTVTQSGGRIWVESKPGEGACFTVFLPRSEREPGAADPARPDADSPAPPDIDGWETVLLVEDDPHIRDIARRVLTAHGYHVLEAPSGMEALDVWGAYPHEIHLLLSDVVMPRMTGRALATRLAAQRPDVGVLYMSGYAEDVLGRSGLYRSQVQMLDKPFTPTTLLRRVRAAIDAIEPKPTKPTRLRERDPMLGRLLAGRYGIYDRIGHGGMGSVYRARQAGMDRIVALKVLPADLATKDSAVRWFHNEARAASRLRHPNTITLFDFGRTGEGLLFLAMEFLEGRSLDRVLSKRRHLPIPRACHIVQQVCASLGEAHDFGVVHRDVKPANVFLTEMGGDPDFVKVLDFGVAALQDPSPFEEDDRPPRQTAVGTPYYMSPEQIRKLPVDGRSDLYAVGVLLFQLVTGRFPFDAEDALSLVLMHLEEPVPDLPPTPDGDPVPGPLADLIRQMLQKDPTSRPRSAAEVEARLAGIAGGA